MSWNYYAPQFARDLGITNHCPEFSELVTEPYEMTEKPFCTSFRCSGSYISNGVKKEAKKSETFCPDCGHVLVWRKERVY